MSWVKWLLSQVLGHMFLSQIKPSLILLLESTLRNVCQYIIALIIKMLSNVEVLKGHTLLWELIYCI